MKELGLTVLFVDTIPARIYLALLKKHGYRPNKIIFLDIEPASKKYKLLKAGIGKFVARKIVELYKRYSALTIPSNLSKIFLKENGLTRHCLNAKLNTYCQNPIEKISVTGINDDRLTRYLRLISPQVVLFTGGGLLKEPVLSVKNIKFLHIHPGIVPEVRGADGFYWSLLLRGKVGYSAFYMEPGIDTGDVIVQQEFEVDFSRTDLGAFENEKIYQAILEFYDPALRIITFINFLNSIFENKSLLDNSGNIDMLNISGAPQNASGGRTYFFMHPSLRSRVIDFFLKKERN
ncbi:Formyl transferase [Marinobacter daqiaonensis]|uniref:Formyl transferase n=1 Tax=Marinobacter daqiaonensis TaxID=650891 RepID=A0A1I6H9M6_9GAMM|nr:formyltransferase family protein [Marinobacter daqiaonensis]SFR51078.1 Formyl transferase [Marinobacter daqiaonensis]